MKLIPNSVTRSIATKMLTTKQNSPHIFFVGGVIGVVGATVMACRATLKLDETLDEVQEDLEAIKPDVVTTKDGDYYRDVGYVYTKSALKIGRLYGPPVVLGVASIAALTGSHISLARRNAALSATLVTVMKAFDEYRVRVKAEIGQDKESDIYHAIENRIVSKPDGSKEVVKIADPNQWSPYARFFDELSAYWEKDAQLNHLYVITQQNYFNHRLHHYGHVFLNEVYDMFGIERTPAGSVVGWVIGPDGDNYIDFGVLKAYNRDFVHGQERSILLDFNVDGVIYDKIGGN